MPRVLIITGDAGEALEVYYPLQRFQEEGWQVGVAAPSRKRIQLVVHDFEPLMETYTEKLGYGLKVQMSFADVRADDYDGLVIPGGRAPEYIRNVPGCVELIGDFNRQGKPIAAICHAVLCLIPAGVVAGRRLTAYPQLAPDVTAAGGTFVDDVVVVDGNLVTARAWPDNPAWMREFIRLIKQRTGGSE